MTKFEKWKNDLTPEKLADIIQSFANNRNEGSDVNPMETLLSTYRALRNYLSANDCRQMVLDWCKEDFNGFWFKDEDE